MRTTQQYIQLLGRFWQGKPNYVAFVTALLSPVAALEEFLSTLNAQFDFDTAIGAQLDVVGQWVGISRNLETPLPNVYFSFDTTGLGFDQGSWNNPFSPTDGLTVLDDDTYRILLKAKRAANIWDGTLPGTLAVLSQLFPIIDYPGYELDVQFTLDSSTLAGSTSLTKLFVYDNNDMSATVGISGILPDAVVLAIIGAGYFPLHPGGVKMNYLMTSVDGDVMFGFDTSNQYIDGLDSGAWGIPVTT